MGFDDVIQRMGNFSPYQMKFFILLRIPSIICAFHKLVNVFIADEVKHRCMLPTMESKNTTFNYISQATFDMYYPYENGKLDLCQMYVNPNESKSKSYCQEYVYDHSVYQSTITSEWDLVCDKAWYLPLHSSLLMVGVMLGSIVFGALSDKYGRRIIFFVSLILQLVSGFGVAFSVNYFMFVIFRVLVGASTSGVFLVSYVIALEMVTPDKRVVAGIAVQFFFSFGYVMTGVAAYFIRSWRMLQIALTAPSLIFVAYWWFIPESARWLLTKGRVEEAKAALKNTLAKSKVNISDKELDELISKNEPKSTCNEKQLNLLDLIRHPSLRYKTILLFFNWFVNSGTYYGLSWSVSHLNQEPYLDFIISGLIEFPAFTFLVLVMDKIGRKKIVCGCMLLTGVCLLLAIFIPKDLAWLTTTLVMTAKLGITTSYGVLYIFTAEQYPTAVRNVGLGACSTAARIGGIAASFLNETEKFYQHTPKIIFGLFTLTGGLFSLLLPETLNKKLPETIEDAENFICIKNPFRKKVMANDNVTSL